MFENFLKPELKKNNFQKGFTLVELMITMVVFVLVIAASSSVFTGLLTQFKQQSKISEINIEKNIALDILRQDLDSAGYGLPFEVNIGWAALNYNEAGPTGGGGVLGPPDRSLFNDGNPVPPGAIGIIGAPRAIVSGDSNGFRGSDYLVIKSSIVAENNASQKWTVIYNENGLQTMGWLPAVANLNNADWVIAMDIQDDSRYRALVISDPITNRFSEQYMNRGNFGVENNKKRAIYGLGPNDPRMPFNRADYWIAFNNVPSQCATGGPGVPAANVFTGVLMKGILTNSIGGGTIATFHPLLDCVADMQIVYGLDMDGNGTIGTYSNADGSTINTSETTTLDGNSVTTTEVGRTLGSLPDNPLGGRDIADLLRRRLREVRVYVLVHEGQRDTTYTYIPPVAPSFIPVGQVRIGGATVLLGRNYDLTPIPNWQNYRWKVYTLVVNPKNLGVK